MASEAIPATTFHRFLDLPYELRVLIYRHAFGKREIVWAVDDKLGFLMTKTAWSEFQVRDKVGAATPLWRTCKAICEEIQAFMLDQVLFRVIFSTHRRSVGHPTTTGYMAWTDKAVKRMIEQMRHVQLTFGFMEKERLQRRNGGYDTFLKLAKYGRDFRSLSVFTTFVVNIEESSIPEVGGIVSKIVFRGRVSVCDGRRTGVKETSDSLEQIKTILEDEKIPFRLVDAGYCEKRPCSCRVCSLHLSLTVIAVLCGRVYEHRMAEIN